MTAIWPTELPRPLVDGYGSRPTDSRLQKQSEIGPAGYRRRGRQSVQRTLVLEVSRDRLARFWRFHDEEVSEGSLPFWMPDPVFDGVVLSDGEDGEPLLTDEGQPIVISAVVLCLFGKERPAESAVSGSRFRLSFPVVQLP